MKRDITLLINKSEITAGTRGSSLGPDAIMAAARKGSSHYFGQYPIKHVDEFNFMLDHDVKYPFSKRIEGLVKVFNSVSDNIQEIISEGRFPLVIAADHGSAGGTIAGIKASYPTKRLGVVWIDAHGDLHTPYTTPSGNMHGMPLATALNEDNREVAINSLSDEVTLMWEELKATGIKGAKVNPEDLVFIAVRDTEKEEKAMINRLNIKSHMVAEVREKGMNVIMNEVNDQLKDCDIIYISFDVDSMDPLFTSHGTGTPVDDGLKPEEAEFFLGEFAKNEKTVCIEFVEVNPCLDEKTNKMAEVTFDLLEKTTRSL
ncbi:MAG: arginase [Crocinitomicaceae bacterium]